MRPFPACDSRIEGSNARWPRLACVVIIHAKDMAEAQVGTKTDRGRLNAWPLLFTTESEE